MDIVRVLAPNPGPYTGPGTNTYVVHDGSNAAVIDPGPIIATHEDAIRAAIGDMAVSAVIVTHNHPDHAPLANPLAQRLGVPSYGFASGTDFVPDVRLSDGETLEVGGFEMTAVHTPGHTWDHLCFLVGSELFTGDHIMGGSTVIIEDAVAYFESLYKVEALDIQTIRPGHGDVIEDAKAAVAEYIRHRKQRELQVIDAVSGGAHTAREIAEAVYVGIDPALIPAAVAQVEVQLRKLISENRLSLGRPDAPRMRVFLPEGN